MQPDPYDKFDDKKNDDELIKTIKNSNILTFASEIVVVVL